ncbi:MAG: NAD(P)H-binding protein [Thermoleophilaceae bacterium]|nr:NAD(P)H-binding protein [Thermoleophilaceae bacterium]
MVLVFGATGFSGSLLVERLLERGLPVRIAARSPEKLQAMSAQHGGLDWVTADASDPESLDRACVGASVLATTVGPYSRSGHVAIEAAIRHRLAYIDITGEPAFIRRVFEHWGPQAAAAGVPLLTAFGYDYVPGNLAAATALETAGAAAVTVNVGYFLAGRPQRNSENFSVGTLESLKASASATKFAFHGGELREQPAGKQVIDFDVSGQQRTAVAIGSTEHFALPRSFPQLQNVNVGLGWFGEPANATTGASSNDAPDIAAPGPSTETQAALTSEVIAVARDADGAELASATFVGPNPYPLSASLVAWAAKQAAAGRISGAGALGPLEAFDMPTLTAACAAVGLKRA